MEERYNLYSQDRTEWTTFKDHEEFQEEDVWSVFEKQNNSNSDLFDSSTIPSRRLSTAARMIPKGNTNLNEEPRLIQHSAPVNIPDWSKIYGTNLKKASETVSFHDDDVDGEGNIGITDNVFNDNDSEELDREMMPPHEWIANKFARTRTSSFSVCEGAGRTLKGRDLSRPSKPFVYFCYHDGDATFPNGS